MTEEQLQMLETAPHEVLMEVLLAESSIIKKLPYDAIESYIFNIIGKSDFRREVEKRDLDVALFIINTKDKHDANNCVVTNIRIFKSVFHIWRTNITVRKFEDVLLMDCGDCECVDKNLADYDLCFVPYLQVAIKLDEDAPQKRDFNVYSHELLVNNFDEVAVGSIDIPVLTSYAKGLSGNTVFLVACKTEKIEASKYEFLVKKDNTIEKAFGGSITINKNNHK